MSAPLLALVGAQNVGKSTLFNRLSGTRAALVANIKGLTRDRQYATCTIKGKEFSLVDTGGAVSAKDEIALQVMQQMKQAIQSADLVLLLVDAQAGVTTYDQLLAQLLREQAKPWILVINKTEQKNTHIILAEFSELAANSMLLIAAAHNIGIFELQNTIAKYTKDIGLKADTFTEAEAEVEADAEAEDVRRLAIIGRPNTGKSSLVNHLLKTKRMVVSEVPGATRDSIDIPACIFGNDYILTDTAGVRRRRTLRETIEKFSVAKTLNAMHSASVAILMIDASEDFVSQDAHLLNEVLESGCGAIIALNKWDLLDTEGRKRLLYDLEENLRFADFVPFCPISALSGKGIRKLFSLVKQVAVATEFSLSTPMANKILRTAVDNFPPPSVGRRRVQLRYAHSGGDKPPVIVIHGTQTDKIDKNYRSYLENTFRKELKLIGTPVRLLFRNANNPYDPDVS